MFSFSMKHFKMDSRRNITKNLRTEKKRAYETIFQIQQFIFIH